jgi:hypothetical protein
LYVRDARIPLKKIEEYRAHAEKCRLMANRARSPEGKSLLLNMAASWDLRG